MHKYGIIFHIFQWLIVLCCMVIIAIGDNYTKAFGCLEDDRIALLKLKVFINNQNRSVPPTWGDEQVEDCCRWEGVICDDMFSKRIVNLSLNISSNLDDSDEWFMDASLFQPFQELQNLTFRGGGMTGIKGSLRLAKLQVLDLSYNLVISHVPLFGGLPSLKFLDLSYNNYHVFPELTSLSSLEFFNLSYNDIEGHIPPSILALTSLKMLGLSNNHLNGSLPQGSILNLNFHLSKLANINLSEYIQLVYAELCSLTYLEKLDLSYNAFEGVLHTCLSNLTSLRLLDLSYNNFSGSIPSNLFSRLKSLQYVSLSHNVFDGLFSFNSVENNSKLEVFQLENDNPMLKVETENVKWKPPFFQLQIFILSNCILNEPSGGIIPSFLLTQYDLRFVDLSNNCMKGQLPTWLLTNNSRLEGLILRNNYFKGPLQLGSYNAHMYWFDISSNQVVGEISTFIGSILPKLIYLDMSMNAIEGRIPSSIKNMRELIKLDLSKNNISGGIPVDLFYGCERLGILKLSNNNLTTFLPSKSPRLPLASRLVLDISFNSFTGRFPDFITELSSLRSLVLSKNHFEGKLPDAFCNLKNLQILDLSWNNFTDSLPPCTHLPSLSYLQLQGNRFHGPLPTYLSKSSSLMFLDVSKNNFTGLIPSWISSFWDLTFLLLSENNFHGSIPSQLCHMEKLNILDLAANNFTGSVPSCLFHIPIGKSKTFYTTLDPWYYNISTVDQNLKYDINFSSGSNDIHFEQVQLIKKSMPRSFLDNSFRSGIDLSLNKLTGPIPVDVDIDNWENLSSLNLSNNYLNGSIPWTLSRLQILGELDLSHNKLSGQIPSEMTRLTFLTAFLVAYNNLSGPIPTIGQFITFGARNYEGNPLLCGPPLVKICGTGHAKPSAEVEQNDISFKIHFLWSFFGSFVVSCIGSFVFLHFGTNVPQMFLRWIGIEERAPRMRTVELPSRPALWILGPKTTLPSY